MENGLQKTENMEGEKKYYSFDIRQKHPWSNPESKPKNFSSTSEFMDELNKSPNPFEDFDGKDLIYNGEKIGTFRIGKEVSYQCVITADGGNDCGYFFKLEINVDTKDIDMEKAIELVTTELKDRKIDLMNVGEIIPSIDNGVYRVQELSSMTIDPKGPSIRNIHFPLTREQHIEKLLRKQNK